MKKKNWIAVVLSLTLMASALAGCGSSGAGSAGGSQAPAQEQAADASAGNKEDDKAEQAEGAEMAAADAPSEELVTIRVSTLAQQLSIPMHYISKMGWDVENGFKLEITTFAQGSGINEALGSGLVDVFTIGAAGVSSCSVYDAVYLFSHCDSGAGQQFMIRADSEMAAEKGFNPDYPEVYGTPDSVKGKSFLLPMGTASQILTDMYLEALGLSEDDVTLINMDNMPAYQAFVSGQSDFASTCYPVADNYDPEQYLAAFSMTNLNCPYYDNILCSREFYEDESKHDALVALCEQLIRVADAFKDDKVLMDTMVEWYDINGQECNPDEIEHQVLERPFFTYDDLTTIDSTASFKMIADFYAVVGNISDEDLEKVYRNMDDVIIKEALEAYKADYMQ